MKFFRFYIWAKKNAERANYCQSFKEGSMIKLDEIYAPGTEQTCEEFLRNYQKK